MTTSLREGLLHLIVKQEMNIDMGSPTDMKLVMSRPDLHQRLYYACNRPSTIGLLDALEPFIQQEADRQKLELLDRLERSLVHIDEHICRFNDGEQTCDCYKEADDIARNAIQAERNKLQGEK